MRYFIFLFSIFFLVSSVFAYDETSVFEATGFSDGADGTYTYFALSPQGNPEWSNGLWYMAQPTDQSVPFMTYPGEIGEGATLGCYNTNPGTAYEYAGTYSPAIGSPTCGTVTFTGGGGGGGETGTTTDAQTQDNMYHGIVLFFVTAGFFVFYFKNKSQ